MPAKTRVSLAVVVWLPLACADAATPGAGTEAGTGTSGTGTSSTGALETTGTGPSSTGALGPTGSDGSGTGGALLCNGHAALCDRPYDQVVFAATHNAHAASDDGFGPLNADQVHGVAQQLEDGVRCLLIDVTYGGDRQTATCHGPCGLGSRPHLEVLGEIAAFLAEEPREVVTIIYEDEAEKADIIADVTEAGLADLVYAHQGGDWPTLAEMIEAQTRLVVTAQNGGPPPLWCHNVWQVAFDTPYTFTDPRDMSCALNRGEASNDLFLLNHWLSTDAGLPSPPDAEIANAYGFLLERAQRCATEQGRIVNFVAVDFYETGDVFAVVDTLNGLDGR